MSAPRRGGNRVVRVDWVPGSDRLRGRCHCGAETEADDPVLLWAWLVAHPDHRPAAPPEATGPPPAHVVTDPALIRRRTTAPR
ncbi:hypothetical protein [Saccharothrix syringae]|uniref:Uncharacterized protein n=1 Tax=Saccharothrix syringae TaxID=103733 RepID=A0A5Q0H1N0_SACSY|nr:hypothetical protein [Saccharothrix syringae]QFZ19764.1 hypothetical protein EKG83_22095 [Saccharothrix syringae]